MPSTPLSDPSRRRVAKRLVPVFALVTTVASLAGLTACSTSSSSDSGSSSSAKASISVLADGNDTASVAFAKNLAKGFMKANPAITVTVDSRPTGTDGDNYVKTRLSTGDMDDVFIYNSGSLFQALNPKKNLVDLSSQSWVKSLDKTFTSTVSAGGSIYGAPTGTTLGGGFLYNKKVYAKLGLSVPKTWAEFISNSKKIDAAGDITPVLETFGDDWTAQEMVLTDFANVAQQDPKWATKYTNNKAKYVNSPALESWTRLAQIRRLDLTNKDYASLSYANGLTELASGKAAQYSMDSSALESLTASNPNQLNDIGFFATPATKASDTAMTVWEPSAAYIPQTTTGAKLTAAEKFVAYINSPAGCKVQEKNSIDGPFVTSKCTLPSSVPTVVSDEQKYIDSGKASPALEFLSPVKGPNLTQIAVEVGSGIVSAKKGAALYDDDVKKQAQQLGLAGW